MGHDESFRGCDREDIAIKKGGRIVSCTNPPAPSLPTNRRVFYRGSIGMRT